MIGKKLDNKYGIVAKLGEGGMGAVYEAEHLATGRHVAIKVILDNFNADEGLVLRFQREARAAGSIESRHIAQVLDAGKDPETSAPYLVMELLKGTDVDALLKAAAPIRPTLALRLVAQALAGLDRAHAAGVVHRDIKPANLYIADTDGGQRVVKLVDFGIAKVKDDVTKSREFSLTQTASLLGSPLYMSPEQARTSKAVDGRADLWSLGCVLFQMLTGEAPHAFAGSLTELLLAICTEPVRPAQDLAPWVSPEIASIVRQALEIDLSKRYAGASAMLADIAVIVPDWQSLDASMFTPLTDAERNHVATRAAPPSILHTSTGPNARTGSKELLTSPSRKLESDTLRTRIESSGVAAISAPGLTAAGGLATTKDRVVEGRAPGEDGKGPPRSRAVTAIIAAGVVAACAAVGFGVARRGPEPTTATSAPPPAASSVPPAVSAPPPVVSASSTAATSGSAPAPSASVGRPPTSTATPATRPSTALPTAAATTTSTPSRPSAAPKPTTAPTSSISRDFN